MTSDPTDEPIITSRDFSGAEEIQRRIRELESENKLLRRLLGVPLSDPVSQGDDKRDEESGPDPRLVTPQ